MSWPNRLARPSSERQELEHPAAVPQARQRIGDRLLLDLVVEAREGPRQDVGEDHPEQQETDEQRRGRPPDREEAALLGGPEQQQALRLGVVKLEAAGPEVPLGELDVGRLIRLDLVVGRGDRRNQRPRRPARSRALAWSAASPRRRRRSRWWWTPEGSRSRAPRRSAGSRRRRSPRASRRSRGSTRRSRAPRPPWLPAPTRPETKPSSPARSMASGPARAAASWGSRAQLLRESLGRSRRRRRRGRSSRLETRGEPGVGLALPRVLADDDEHPDQEQGRNEGNEDEEEGETPSEAQGE